VLLGRDEECARIERLLEDARGGRSRTLVIRGEAGIGKSALLEYAVEHAPEMLVLRTCGVESESELAFSGLLELCRPLLDRLDDLPERQAAALGGALALGPAEAVDRFTVGAATLGLVGLGAEATPILVVIDDAHWLDDASTDAILFAARRLEADRAAFVFAAREGEGVFSVEDLPELQLRGLDVVATAELLSAASGAEVDPGVAERLWALTHGNALALVELPRVLSAGQLAAREPLEEPLQVGTEVERAFARRAASLGEGPRRALLIAAANESGELDVTAAALASQDLDLAALETIEDAELIRLERDRLTFRHPLVRSAVYHAAAPSERRAAHRALAEALAGDPRAEDRRAWHLAAATVGPDENVAAALERAAAIARERSGWAAAAAAYERAARLTLALPLRLGRLYWAAEAAWMGGNTSRAIALVDEALDSSPDSSSRAGLLGLRGHIERHTGDQMTAYAMLVEAASLLSETDRSMAVATLVDAFECCLYGGEPERGVAAARRLYALARANGGSEEFFANFALGCGLTWIGESEEGAVLLERAISLVERRGVTEGSWRYRAWAAVAPLWLDQRERGHRFATEVVAGAREEGAMAVLPYALQTLSYYTQSRGQWAAACTLASEGAAVARELGHPADLCHCLFELAFMEAAQGNEQAARAHIIEATHAAGVGGVDPDRVFAARRLGLLELSLGHLDRAIEALEPLSKRLEARGVKWLDHEEFPSADLVEAYVRSGRTQEAESTLSAFPELTAANGRPWLVAVTERCRALLAGDDFEAHFAAALTCHAEAGDVFEHARTRLCLGERLRRAGRRKDARDELRAALAVFEELGATAWAKRTRAELRATGEKLRRRDPTAAEQLTPQELQIALHVSEGKTNRDVGATLFLSPKTVEFHLGGVYRKLGIHSRAELIRLFASQTGPSDVPPFAPARGRSAQSNA
jgi:DNA-binding CsgD family transcriptional regulator